MLLTCHFLPEGSLIRSTVKEQRTSANTVLSCVCSVQQPGRELSVRQPGPAGHPRRQRRPEQPQRYAPRAQPWLPARMLRSVTAGWAFLPVPALLLPVGSPA